MQHNLSFLFAFLAILENIGDFFMVFQKPLFASLLALLALSILFLPPGIGHNENQAPVHSHTSTSWGVTTVFWPPSISKIKNGDCETVTIEVYYLSISTTTCTHGVASTS